MQWPGDERCSAPIVLAGFMDGLAQQSEVCAVPLHDEALNSELVSTGIPLATGSSLG